MASWVGMKLAAKHAAEEQLSSEHSQDHPGRRRNGQPKSGRCSHKRPSKLRGALVEGVVKLVLNIILREVRGDGVFDDGAQACDHFIVLEFVFGAARTSLSSSTSSTSLLSSTRSS